MTLIRKSWEGLGPATAGFFGRVPPIPSEQTLKKNGESGFVRLIVAIFLVVVGFFIAFSVLQSVHRRMASSSLLERLPIVLVLLVLCAAVFAYARFKRGGSKEPDEKDSQEEDS